MPTSAGFEPHAASDGAETGSDGRRPAAEPPGLRCDFCGDIVPSVRRVALDHDYDRLQPSHRELYACPPCSERKERERLGLERS